MQHAGLPCPSLTSGVYSNSCPLGQWYHPTISSSVLPSSSCLPSFPTSGSFLMSQFFASGGQSDGVSTSASALPMEYSGLIAFWMDWLDLLAVQVTIKSLPTPPLMFKSISSSALSFLYSPALMSIVTTGKTIALTRRTFEGRVIISLLYNMLSWLVITFLARSKHLLISRLQSPSAVILELKKIKSVAVSIVSPSICHEVMGPNAVILIFWMLSFKPTFSLSFTFIKRLFSSSLVSAIRVVSSAYLRLMILFQAILIPACA